MFMLPLVAVLAFAALAQTAPDAPEEQLRAGDEVRVSMPGQTVTSRLLTIDEKGRIDLETYGSVQLAGLVVLDARDALRRHLTRWIRTVDAVDLILVRRGASVLISGMVARPGVMVLREPEDLWQALQRAGGLLPGADLTRVSLRREGVRVPVDLWAFLTHEGGGPLPLLRAGDTVFVPADAALPAVDKAGTPYATPQAMERKLFVLGAVLRGGIFEAAPGLDLVTALALAGGPSPAADLTRVRVAASGATTSWDVSRMLDGRDPSPPLPGGGGLVVYVPAGQAGDDDPLRGSVTVLGAVRGTGRVQTGRPLSLGEVLSLAGGTTDKADLRHVRLTQRQRGLTISSRYDVTAAGDGIGALARVKAGDTVFVATELRAQDDIAPWVQVVSGIVLTVSSILVLSGVR